MPLYVTSKTRMTKAMAQRAWDADEEFELHSDWYREPKPAKASDTKRGTSVVYVRGSDMFRLLHTKGKE